MGLSDAIERLLGGAPAPNVSTASHAHGLAAAPEPPRGAGEDGAGDPGAPRDATAPPTDHPDVDAPVGVAVPTADRATNGDAAHDPRTTGDASPGPPVAELLGAAAAAEAQPAVTRHVASPLAEIPAEAAAPGVADAPPAVVDAERSTTPPSADGAPAADAPTHVGWEPTPPSGLPVAPAGDTFPAAWSPPVEPVVAVPVEPVSAPAEPLPSTSVAGPMNGAGPAHAPDAQPELVVDPPATVEWSTSGEEAAPSPPAATPPVSAADPALAVPAEPSGPPPPVDVVPAPYEWDPPLPQPVVDTALPPVTDAAPPSEPAEPLAAGPRVAPPEPETIDVEAEASSAAPGPTAPADVPERPVPELPAPTAVGFEQLEATATIVESLGLGYHLGSAIERIVLSETRGIEGVPSLREAIWLIERHIELARGSADAETLAAIRGRLVRNGDVIAGLQALSVAVDARRSGGPVPAPPAPPRPPAAAAPAGAAPAPAPRPAPARPLPADGPAVVADAPDAQASLLAEALRRTPPGPEHDGMEDYPLGREILVMAVRFGLILVVIVVVVLVITLAATLT